MSKTKSTIVTALVAGMLAAILFGLYRLYPLAFTALIGILALCGFACLTLVFFCWLGGKTRERKAMLPVEAGKNGGTSRTASPTEKDGGTSRTPSHAEKDEAWAPDAAWIGDYDAIKAEVQEAAG